MCRYIRIVSTARIMQLSFFFVYEYLHNDDQVSDVYDNSNVQCFFVFARGREYKSSFSEGLRCIVMFILQ